MLYVIPFLAFVALSVVFLPMAAQWRAVWLLGILATVTELAWPPRLAGEPSVSGVPTLVYLVIIVLPFVIGLFLRAAFGRGVGLDRYTSSDPFLAALSGGVLTLIAVRAATFSIAASDAPTLVHMALLATIACLIYATITLRGYVLVVTSLAGAVGALGLVGAYSLFHPTMVQNAAIRMAGNAPFCISLQTRKRGAVSENELTFLAMDKSREIPHALVFWNDGENLRQAHWSYRTRRFEDPREAVFGDPGNSPHCDPLPGGGLN